MKREAHRQKIYQFGNIRYLDDEMFEQQLWCIPKPIEKIETSSTVGPGSGRVGLVEQEKQKNN